MDRRRYAFALVGVAAARYESGTRLGLRVSRRSLGARRRIRPRASDAASLEFPSSSPRRSFAGRWTLSLEVALLLAAGVATVAGCGGGESAQCDVTVVDPDRATEIEPLESGDYSIEFQTTHGNFTVAIDEELAPCNGASMLQLAEDGFFDGIAFHRIVPGFVIQAGQSTETPDGGLGHRRSTRRRPTRSTPRASWRWRRPGSIRPAPAASSSS